MKKINVLIIAVIAVTAAFMTSCKNDTTDFAAPTVTFDTDTGNQTVMVNSDVAISGDIYAAGEIKQIIYFKDDASFGDAITSGFDTDTTTHFSMSIPGDQVTETFTFEVQVTDKNDKIGKGSVTITVQQGQPVVKHSGLQINCATADQTSHSETEGDYASLTTFEVWSHNQAENNDAAIALIDVCYYNGDYTKDLGGTPHLVSPDDCPAIIHLNTSGVHEDLNNANHTLFLTLDDASAFSDWTAINDDYEISAIDMSNAITNVGGFAQGDVIAFELENGKKGVLKAVGGTSGYGNSDYILVDVIVQEQIPVK